MQPWGSPAESDQDSGGQVRADLGAREVGLDEQAGGEGRAGSSQPGLLRGVQVGVTWL